MISVPRRGVLAGLLAAPMVARGQTSQQLTVWHDLGENGNKWFGAVATAFGTSHPGVTLRATSYPTDQWFGRVIGALNTSTAPDLVFNNYERVIRVATQTGKVMDLRPVLAALADKGFLSEDDLRVATYEGRMIILPVQRVQMAFGARRSWLERVGEPFPVTWDDTMRVARKFRDGHPDGDPNSKVFAFGLEAAQPRDLIHILDLFIFGAGLRNTLIDPAGAIVVDEPQHAHVLEEFLKTYTTYRFVSPDTINYSFGEMYQVIEGGKAGMFRVGDWNVAKWDTQALNGDFVVGAWPKFFPDHQNGVVIGGMRGIAVPENSPHKELAIEFAKFLLSAPAQQASLAIMGAAVRKDLDVGGLSPRQQAFARPAWALYAYDFPESVHPFYPQLEAAYHRKLLDAIAHPPADFAPFIASTAQEMRVAAKQLAEKKG
jgi:ABC-type glycerol-3-phosphate transport system substrate-binding protein